MIKDQRILIILATVLSVFLIATLVLLVYIPQFYFNLSESEPIGLYRVIPLAGDVNVGDLVLIETPKCARPYVYGRGWLPEGWCLFKNVGAVWGDNVTISDHDIRINDRYIGPIAAVDSHGLPLPRLRGDFTIKKGSFLPISTFVNNSFDGRYFGPVPLSLIRGKAIPVYIFKRR